MILGKLMGNVGYKLCAIAIAILLTATLYYHRETNRLENVVSQKTTENKSLLYGTAAYKDERDKWHAISIQQTKSIDNLKDDKDSLTTSMRALLKAYKIKANDVTQTGTVVTKLKHDTIIAYKPSKIDTVYDLSSLPYIKELIKIDSIHLSRDLEIYNTQNLIWHSKRETIDPPKFFFLLRWFQKKHTVTYVDIINENPFIKTTKQDFKIITK